MWSVLQKWILALPANTDKERARRLSLQKELERILSELDDGAGIGEDGVCLISPQGTQLIYLLTFSIAGVCPL